MKQKGVRDNEEESRGLLRVRREAIDWYQRQIIEFAGVLSEHAVPDEVRSRFHEVFATDVIPKENAEDMTVRCKGCGREVNLAEAFSDAWRRLLEWLRANDR